MRKNNKIRENGIWDMGIQESGNPGIQESRTQGIQDLGNPGI